MTLTQMITRLQRLDVAKTAFEILTVNQDRLIEIQFSQLWAGRNLKGELLQPSILDDPFFKGNARFAKWWADRKEYQRQWVDNPEFGIRPYGVANLIFSSGKIVWDTIRVFPAGADLYIRSGSDIQSELEQKYGAIFGLNPQGREYAIKNWLKDALFAGIRKELGINI
jgi:hypothetical protein